MAPDRGDNGAMRATVLHTAHDVRVEDVPDATIEEPTDVVIRTVATCICGSDLWGYRGISATPQPRRIGHEAVGQVTQVGAEVHDIHVDDWVIIPFFAACGQCAMCRAGRPYGCPRLSWYEGCQAEQIRVPWADATCVVVSGDGPGGGPPPELIPSLLTISDVMGTGWHAAVSAGVGPGSTAVVVGDGAVGLCGVLAAATLGAERVIAMSRHEDRAALARRFGATDIVPERGEEGIARIRELTGGWGAESVLECVGTDSSLAQAIGSTAPGGTVGWVGVPHQGTSHLEAQFRRNIAMRGGMAPTRIYAEDLVRRVLAHEITPGLVLDRTVGLSEVATGYELMDQRHAIKVMVDPTR